MTSPNSKSAELKDQVTQQLQTLIDQATDVRASEDFQRWLAFAARFHRYSFSNMMLILCQRPTATRVAGYKKWQTLGRQVQKGEKGIAIFAPMPRREEQDDPETGETVKVQTGIRFKVVHVFDVSQTDGDDLPASPDCYGDGRHEELEVALLGYAHSLGIETTDTQHTVGSLGTSSKGKITYTTATGNVPVTIAHEIAHELTPTWRAELGRDTTEALIEAAAAIVCEHFGVDARASSANYIAGWAEDPAQLLNAMERVQRLASQIIENVETRLTSQDRERSLAA